MMHDAERLSALIGDIYDAALDRSLWPRVLEDTASFVGGTASALILRDSVHKRQNNLSTWGYDPEFVRIYLDKYIRLDPFTTMQFFFDVEQPISIADLMPHTEFRKISFYREWVQPQGWIDAVGVTLEKLTTSYAALFVIRHETNGVVDDEARRRTRLIAPHFRRAVLIGKAIDLRQGEAATFADAFNGLSAGIFLVDAGGRIIHANAAGHGILNGGDVLKAAGGRLIASDPQVDNTLREIFVAAGSGDAALGTQGIAVPLTAGDGQHHVAHVLPLTSGARRRAGTAYTAAAALFVRKAVMEQPSPPEVIARAYKLTPTELRVLLAIVEVGGAPDVAAALGVAESTVKTHLGRLFEKTGAARQADLVKLVAGFASPLVA
jgi:DNA-binding CsgD family transcriptional regulator